MMYKIILVERGWWTASWDLSRPRQMFVTCSPMLSRRVQRTVSQILESFRLADMTQQELVDIWKRQARPVEHSRPLPRKWSELEDDHFPLIISFDKVRRACMVCAIPQLSLWHIAARVARRGLHGSWLVEDPHGRRG